MAAAKGIGAALRAIRERQQLTMTAVARRAKISDAMLSRIERGERLSPQFVTVARIAYALGTSLDEVAHECGLPTAVHRRTPSSAAGEIRLSENLLAAERLLTRASARIAKARRETS
jgi:transcriptional regulator with XRE-family HTH domain